LKYYWTSTEFQLNYWISTDWIPLDINY